MNPLAAKFHDEPALFESGKKSMMESALWQAAQGFHGKSLNEVMAAAANDDSFWGEPGSFLSHVRPYTVVDGVLQIPVKGVLLNDFPYQFGTYATGYQYIYRCYDRGLRDGSVRGIAFMINSPGGEVAGNFELVDKLFALRGQKPTRAFAFEYAYSAAYSIASVADEIWVSRTGGVGSIGVVCSHVSYEEMNKRMGIEITYIFAGEHKVDGNPDNALPAAVKSRIQERIDALYDVFVSTVARNRDMEEKAVRDTKALTFMASEAVANGLADKIGTVEDATTAFVEFLANIGDNQMATPRTPAEQAAFNEGRTEGEAAGRTAAETASANATAAAATAAAKAERERVAAIMGIDGASARPAAVKLLIKTGASVEDATGHLKDVPEEIATAKPPKTGDEAEGNERPASANLFEEAMNKDKHPKAGAPTGATGEEVDTGPGARGRAAMARRHGETKAA